MQSAVQNSLLPPPGRHNLMASPPYLNYFLSGKNTKTVASASRRKHQKSRRGCATCKRRHIRCDETWPRCHNCTKHQSDCHYPEIHHETASGNATSTKDSESVSQERGSLETSEVEEELCALQVTSPVVQTKNKPGPVNISPHSLDPCVGSATPLTSQRREQLAFCKSALGHHVLSNHSQSPSYMTGSFLPLLQIPMRLCLLPYQYMTFVKPGTRR